MNSALESQLKTIGLADKEARVYLASLELGPATAQQISQKAGVNRATTYVQIESLTEKGLISSYEKGKKTFFNAESPEFLLRLVEKEKNRILEKESILKGIFPELKILFEYAGDRPTVRFFEGKEGLKTMREDFLKTKDKKIESVFHRDVIEKVFSEKERQWFTQQRIQKKIFTRSLYARKEGKVTTEIPYTKRYWIPQDMFPISADITLYGNKVGITAFEGKPIGIIIESRNITDTIRTIFNLAWENAEKYNK